ncbi:hypothetical protein OPV22_000498 [Ensete ventricosum]|uniref:Uncharacterized protein n=1 Tax=Ensete ventricosum TaxID=4639 RepID=A0AAV8RJ69_ENSVE|nr:hypothetical protein OPV22_000498 [Ensete ventricosum]
MATYCEEDTYTRNLIDSKFISGDYEWSPEFLTKMFDRYETKSRRLVKRMFVRIILWEHIPQHSPTVVDQIVPQNLLEQRHLIYTKFAVVSSVTRKQMVNAASFVFDVRQLAVSPAIRYSDSDTAEEHVVQMAPIKLDVKSAV